MTWRIPTITIAEAKGLPRWRQPAFMLFLMAAAMPIAFSTWSALLNNFVKEAAGFTGVEIGWLHTVREIPGFLAIGVIVILWVMREQVLAVSGAGVVGGYYGHDGDVPQSWRHSVDHAPLVDRVSLFRNRQPVAAVAVDRKKARAANPWLDYRQSGRVRHSWPTV